MGNFIGLVFATLKNEGIDTSGMSKDEAIEKFNELKGKDGGTPAEQRKLEERGISKKEPSEDERLQTILEERNQNEDLDFAKDTGYFGYGSLDALEKAHKEGYSKENKDTPKDRNYYNKNKTDKFGNYYLNDELRQVGIDAGKKYVDEMKKYNSMDKLIQSNVFPQYLMSKIEEGINKKTNDVPDMSIDELEEMVGEITGYKFDYNAYQSNAGNWTKYFTKGNVKDDSQSWEQGKYTGDAARFNKLHNAMSKGKVGDNALGEMLDELGINENGVETFKLFNEMFNKDNNPDQAIQIAKGLHNKSMFRK